MFEFVKVKKIRCVDSHNQIRGVITNFLNSLNHALYWTNTQSPAQQHKFCQPFETDQLSADDVLLTKMEFLCHRDNIDIL